MLLVRLYINGSWRYISDVDQMAHVTGSTYRQYRAGIITMDEIRIATRNPWGGYAEPQYGAVTLTPDLFTADWPPPAKCEMRVCWGELGESDEQILIMGSAYLQEIGPAGIVYGLYAPDYSAEVEDLDMGTPPSTTRPLLDEFSQLVGNLGLTLKNEIEVTPGTYQAITRVPSPGINWTAGGRQYLLNVLSDMAAFYCHRFYIDGTSLWLMDCFVDNGTLALEPSDILSTGYVHLQPVRRLEMAHQDPNCNDYRIVPTSLQGPTRTAVAFAELDIKTTVESDFRTPAGLACADATPLYPLANLIDGNSATFWAADYPVGDTGVPQFLQWNTGNVSLQSYRLTARNDSYRDQSAASWRLEAFDTNRSIWRKMMDVVAEEWSIGAQMTFSAPMPEWPAQVSGSYAYGEDLVISPVCVQLRANKLAHLANIKTLVDMPRARVQIPLQVGKIPKIGQRIEYTDTSLRVDTNVWMRVASITYDFLTHSCVVEGEGALSIA